jgi:putative isomerase
LKKLIYILSTSLFFSCAKEGSKDYLKFSQNILDYQITPTTKFDKSGLMFSDQGAWFGYSFPDSISRITGFSGPFLMTQQNGIWSSASLTNLVVENTNWSSISTKSFNSHLEQNFQSDNIELKQQLVFSSGHTAIVKSTLKNKRKSAQTIQYHFKNEPLLADGLKLSTNNNQLTIKSSKTDAIGHIVFPNDVVLTSTDSTYISDNINIELKPNETKEFTISQTFIFKEYSWKEELKSISDLTYETILASRKTEKNTELQLVIENRKEQFTEDINAEVLAKAQLTLQNHWRIPAG